MERLSYMELHWALDQLDLDKIMCCLIITLSGEDVCVET